jgi:phage baseplate assembly protein W
MASDEQRIGYGLLKPLRREATDFGAGTGQPLLGSCVRTVINTRAAGFEGRLAGEYPWRKNFGTWVQSLRHSNLNMHREDMGIIFLAMAIQRWEPRVVAETSRSTLVPTSGSDRTKTIRLYYTQSEAVSADTLPAPYQESHEEAVL